MTSILSAFPFLAEQSFATPGAWNSPLSIISANIAAINADVGAISGVTISPPSGNTIQMPSDLSISGYLSVGKGVSIGTQAPGIPEPAGLTINVNSGISDYLCFNDTSNLRSDYLIGSHAGGTADGLNIFDVSGNTMIVSFSKQSVRFWQHVVGKSFDAGGAVFNVKTYGAVGDGVADDTGAINLTIATAALAGGGVVFFPGSEVPGQAYKITSTITLAVDNIRLQGVGWNISATNPPPSFIKMNTVDAPLIATNGNRFGISIFDLGLSGMGSSGTSSMGLSMVSGYEVNLQRIFFDQFSSSAVSLGGSVIGATLINLHAQNSLRGSIASFAGVFDLSATDVRAFSCFATTGKFGAGSIGNGNQLAWMIRSSPGMFFGCMGDQAHHGWLVQGAAGSNAFLGCRAYQNQGNGFIVNQGPGNRFMSCTALANSQTADNTYAGFKVAGYGNVFMGNSIDGQSGDVRQQSNGFDDSNAAGGNDADATANRYSNNFLGTNVRGRLYNMTGGNAYRIDHPHRVSDDKGDASITWNAFVDADTIYYQTPLTANRTVTLAGNGTTTVPKGTRVHVVRRLAATGAFDLGVVGTETVNLAPGQSVDFEFLNDSQWHPVGGGYTPFPSVVVLTDAATIAVDASLGNAFKVTLAGNRILGAASNPVNGQRIHFTIVQDGTGSRTLNVATNYPNLAWSDAGNAAGKRSTIAAIYDGSAWNQDGAQAPYM